MALLGEGNSARSDGDGGQAPDLVAERAEHTCVRDVDRPIVNGVQIDPVSPEAFLERMAGFRACGLSHVVHFLPADPIVIARHRPSYRQLLNAGDLNVADGQAVAWACRLSGYPTRRIAGTEGFTLVAEWGVAEGVAHYLFGGEPTVVSALGERLTAQWPGIRVVGVESPPFRELSEAEMAAYAADARRVGADALWVGLGTPKQDVVAERLRALQAAPIILCVGAAFDFLAGSKRRAPAWMQNAGLEWLHRLASEPSRLWRRYLIGNPQFMAGVAADRIASWRTGALPRVPRGARIGSNRSPKPPGWTPRAQAPDEGRDGVPDGAAEARGIGGSRA